MTETPDAKTLDLVGLLSGRDYPELEVDVYFDEKLGFSIYQMRKMLDHLQILGKYEEYEKIEAELRDLVEKAQGGGR